MGRASRSECWWFVVFGLIVGFVLGFVDGVFNLQLGYGAGFLGLLGTVFLFVPSLAVGVRRLHDTNRSGWWHLLMFLPVIGWIVLLVFYCLPGTQGANRFGAET